MPQKIIIPIIIWVLLLSACGKDTSENIKKWATNQQEAPTVSKSLEKVGTTITQEPAFRSCIAQAVQACSIETVWSLIKTEDSSKVCDSFQDDKLQSDCKMIFFTEKARKTLNLTECDNISDTTNRGECKKIAILDEATKKTDPKICEKFDDLKEFSSSSGSKVSVIMSYDLCVLQVIGTQNERPKQLKSCKLVRDETLRIKCSENFKM